MRSTRPQIDLAAITSPSHNRCAPGCAGRATEVSISPAWASSLAPPTRLALTRRDSLTGKCGKTLFCKILAVNVTLHETKGDARRPHHPCHFPSKAYQACVRAHARTQAECKRLLEVELQSQLENVRQLDRSDLPETWNDQLPHRDVNWRVAFRFSMVNCRNQTPERWPRG